MNRELAIVIPAYKSRFLARALASVAGQPMKDARLYVFDDASSEPIEPVARAALSGSSISWSYERFEQNLGGVALTKHYDRCVRRTNEQWVWLFADDDIMEESCVAAFWKTIEVTGGRYDVYCFDSVEVDAQDQITTLHPVLPDWESWKQYAYFLFAGYHVVPQQAVIFSRAAYERLGAFADFPLAWCSDQATLMALAGKNGIKRIAGPKVRFRNSGRNISSIEDRVLSSRKLQASMQFIRWVLRQLDEVPDRDFAMSDESLRQLAFAWFRKHLAVLHTWYSPRECLQTARFLTDTCREPYGKALARMVKLNLSMVANLIRFQLFHSSRSAGRLPKRH